MCKRNYVISGFTPELAARWEKHFRKDLKLFVDNKTGECRAKICLSAFEAMRIKVAMVKYNLTHPCVLQLNKVKAKRYRV